MHREQLQLLVTVAVAVALTGLLFAIDPIRDAVAAAFSGDLGTMRSELDSLGAAAALVLIGIALVHAVVPFPAEFPTAAAGFVFGFAIAFPLMVLAWTVSCLAAYLLARGVGPPVLDRLVGRERMQAADRLIARGGWPILVAGRLIPIVPYNMVSYAAGATRVPIGRFTWTSAVGVIPLTALTALLGARLQEPRFDDPVLWMVLLGVLGLLALARPSGAACALASRERRRAPQPARHLLVDARVVEQLEVVHAAQVQPVVDLERELAQRPVARGARELTSTSPIDPPERAVLVARHRRADVVVGRAGQEREVRAVVRAPFVGVEVAPVLLQACAVAQVLHAGAALGQHLASGAVSGSRESRWLPCAAPRSSGAPMCGEPRQTTWRSCSVQPSPSHSP